MTRFIVRAICGCASACAAYIRQNGPSARSKKGPAIQKGPNTIFQGLRTDCFKIQPPLLSRVEMTIRGGSTCGRLRRNARSTARRTGGDVDRMIGSLLRSRRMALGMSQTALGKSIGVTFQQIQKYERATNRISGATLYRFAKVLEVPVNYFFQDLPKTENGRSESRSEAIAFLTTKKKASG